VIGFSYCSNFVQPVWTGFNNIVAGGENASGTIVT